MEAVWCFSSPHAAVSIKEKEAPPPSTGHAVALPVFSVTPHSCSGLETKVIRSTVQRDKEQTQAGPSRVNGAVCRLHLDSSL